MAANLTKRDREIQAVRERITVKLEELTAGVAVVHAELKTFESLYSRRAEERAKRSALLAETRYRTAICGGPDRVRAAKRKD